MNSHYTWLPWGHRCSLSCLVSCQLLASCYPSLKMQGLLWTRRWLLCIPTTGKEVKNLLHSLPSVVEVVLKLELRARKGRLYLSNYFFFFFCLSSHRRHFTVLGRRRFLASGCERAADQLIFTHSSLSFQDRQKKFKNKWVSYIHSCYFTTNSPFLSSDLSSEGTKAAQNHLL